MRLYFSEQTGIYIICPPFLKMIGMSCALHASAWSETLVVARNTVVMQGKPHTVPCLDWSSYSAVSHNIDYQRSIFEQDDEGIGRRPSARE